MKAIRVHEFGDPEDNSIIFPSITATLTSPPLLTFSSFDRFEFQRTYGCQAQNEV